jgi:HTH-type transcriptional regulator/antitoxin HigA
MTTRKTSKKNGPGRATGTARRTRRPASRTYLALVRAFPIRPLRSEAELDEAIAVIDELLARARPLDRHEEDYLASLGHEVERYEDAAYPMPDVSGPAMVRYLIDSREVSLSAVSEATGIALSTLSDILRRKRKLNLDHIRALAPYFGVEPAVFLS